MLVVDCSFLSNGEDRCQITPYLPLPRKHSPDSTSQDWDGGLKTYLFQKSFPDVLLWWLRLRGPRNNICYSGHVKYFSDWFFFWLITTHLYTPTGWKVELAWLLTYSRRFTHSCRPQTVGVSCRSSAGYGKFAGQRPTFYHCATQPTTLLHAQLLCVSIKWTGRLSMLYVDCWPHLSMPYSSEIAVSIWTSYLRIHSDVTVHQTLMRKCL